jgi:hypothetical protein
VQNFYIYIQIPNFYDLILHCNCIAIAGLTILKVVLPCPTNYLLLTDDDDEYNNNASEVKYICKVVVM